MDVTNFSKKVVRLSVQSEYLTELKLCLPVHYVGFFLFFSLLQGP